MTRAQCIVYREERLLMVQHRQHGETWWCLPGGGVEPGETPAQAALRELGEECCVDGAIVRETSHLTYAGDDETYTFLVEIGDQVPQMGADPEFPGSEQVLSRVAWLALAEIAERDRTFLWAAGLLGVPPFLAQVSGWGDQISYPGLAE